MFTMNPPIASDDGQASLVLRFWTAPTVEAAFPGQAGCHLP
jgi:hypothetical protein